MNKYVKKQIVIGLIYFLLFIVIADLIFLKIQSGKPTCHDGIQNQDEAGVDCGGPCNICPWQGLELRTISAEAIKTKDNYVDLLAKVRNPERNWGAEEFSYTFNLFAFRTALAKV